LHVRSNRRVQLSAIRVGALILFAAAVASGIAASAPRPTGLRFVTQASGLANRCFAITSAARRSFLRVGTPTSYVADSVQARATPFYLKPTGLGTYLIFDTGGQLLSGGSKSITRTPNPGASTEWTIIHLRRTEFAIRSTANQLELDAARASGKLQLVGSSSPAPPKSKRFEFAPDRGCLDYPEAQVGAFGRTFRGARHNGRLSGFVDLHVHITADMRAGGEVIYGESFDRFGITQALSAAGDERVHGPDGVLDVTGNLIRHGTPTGTTDNHGWPTGKGWPTYDTITHQQVYYVWLKRAWLGGLRLIVAQTVDDRSLCEIEARRDRTCDETQSIIGQVERLHQMQDYIDAQSGGRGRGWFRLVYDPAQARRVIKQGKLAVVLGVESSDPFGCSQYLGRPQCTRADIDRGLGLFYRLGIRTMFPVHWVNNAFGGAALEGGAEGKFIDGLNVVQTGAPFVTVPCTRAGEIEQPDANGMPAQCNSVGLTGLGAYLIHQMIAKHMMIEADHMSERMRDSVLAIAQAGRYPLVSSHNGTGGAWSAAQLTELYRLGGMAAVTPDTAPHLADKILALERDRSPGQYFGVGLGTDTGGLGGQPEPRADASSHPLRYPFHSYLGNVEFVRERTGDFTYDLNTDGVAHYGLIADLIADIQQGQGNSQALPPLFRSAEMYLETWQRAFAHT
jgi:microsomal dipeptidase-like Zn-dependent dipeptidase